MARPFAPALRMTFGALGILLALSAPAARAQMPQPMVPNEAQRSGLISRMTPIIPLLPTDPDRDNWYDTYWDDHPKPPMSNSCKDGGLYGLRLPVDCTKCFYPSFRGAPGANTLRADCQPHCRASRIVTNFFHPFRPVCHYYAGGCYVPVYDLDPLVTGPGPFPGPILKKQHNGG